MTASPEWLDAHLGPVEAIAIALPDHPATAAWDALLSAVDAHQLRVLDVEFVRRTDTGIERIPASSVGAPADFDGASSELLDVALVTLGEAREAAGESASVLSPALPAGQIRLLQALAETGTPLVVLVFAARPLALGPVPALARALVYAWHGGHGGPEGVADILFGDAEPSGRLPVTLPLAPGAVPLSHAIEPTGRPFRG